MSSQSPFELRMRMLEMAKEYLDTQYSIAHDAVMASWQTSVDYAIRHGKEAPKMPEMPKMYDIASIAKYAENFNAFVSEKR